MGSSDDQHHLPLRSFGFDRLGLVTIRAPFVFGVLFLFLSVFGALGAYRIKVDDSLSELFRTDTKEFHEYEEIDRRFPSSEYDVLVVVEGAKLLSREGLEAFSRTTMELQLADGVAGLVSMLSARGKPDPSGYAAPVVPDDLPEDPAAFEAVVNTLRTNDIVKGKFLSADGQLALIVLSLDRKVVEETGAREIIGGIKTSVDKELEGSGLTSRLTGAPVMQLEIRNAVERDRLVYNGLGLLFGASIALVFFRRLSFMIIAAVPPLIAVVMSLGLLGWLGFRLNLFLNVMTPLVMVMGFSDSMQMVAAIRDRLRHGDDKLTATKFAVRVVGPACVLAHGTALLAFLALLFSQSGLIRTFGAAGALSTIVSYIAVLGVLPILSILSIRNEASLSKARAPADGAMDFLGTLVGGIVDHVVHRAWFYTLLGLVLFVTFSYFHFSLEPRYRLADQVPDREQALKATGSLDQKLTGANPVHIMITWKDGRSLYDPEVLETIRAAHDALEQRAGLGNVWSIESLRRWLAEAGEDNIETVKKYIGILPEHLVRRFIAKEENAVLVTGRLPDIDASQLLPVVDKIDGALDEVRKAHPSFQISVTGLPAIAARNSASMIQHLAYSLPIAVAFVSSLIGLAFGSVFIAVLSLAPGLFPIVTTGTLLKLSGHGLEFASVVALIVIFGLGIDSLIHFLNRLRREETPGEDPALAIRRARVLVGPAIILTTIVLAFGLGVTVFSDLPSLRLFGWVCAVTLLASLIADLVFLPAMIALYRNYFPLRA